MPWAAAAAGVVFAGSRGSFLGIFFCPLLLATPTLARSQKPSQAHPLTLSHAPSPACLCPLPKPVPTCSSSAPSQDSSPTRQAHLVALPRSPGQPSSAAELASKLGSLSHHVPLMASSSRCPLPSHLLWL